MSEIFENFFGNSPVAQTLAQMRSAEKIPQTILLNGPEGIGKATLTRRFAAALLGDADKIEKDDLSRPENIEVIEAREKWTAEKRNDDPLLFASHPDFVTYAPDGPLRQLNIQQMRLLRERAQFKPLRGNRRVFLIDHLDRANAESANSLLKLLEEPPDHLILIATVQNLYDLLPTIRSRSVVLTMARLSDDELQSFSATRQIDDAEARIPLVEGSPGKLITLDLEQYRARRELFLTALECAAQLKPFSAWVAKSEGFGNRKTEKLEFYLKIGFSLLEDLLRVFHGREALAHRDIAAIFQSISERVNSGWIAAAARTLDELARMNRRNIQKVIALDAFIINLRNLTSLQSTYT